MISLPNCLEKLKPLPEDPADCQVYGCFEAEFNAIVKIYPINQLLPYDDQDWIDGIHDSLDEDQGLIKVEKSKTTKGQKYIYSIIKTYLGPEEGIQYFLRLQILLRNDNMKNEGAYDICAFFTENGKIGIREATVFAEIESTKIKDYIGEGWTFDPYNSSLKDGLLMNQSEKEDYDEMFPNHPLTKCREFVTFIMNNN